MEQEPFPRKSLADLLFDQLLDTTPLRPIDLRYGVLGDVEPDDGANGGPHEDLDVLPLAAKTIVDLRGQRRIYRETS